VSLLLYTHVLVRNVTVDSLAIAQLERQLSPNKRRGVTYDTIHKHDG